jgi:hypothetical protein
VLPQLRQLPRLLSGYWLATTEDRESLAILLFDNEDAAQEMAQVGPAERTPASGRHPGTIEVREAIASI